MAKATDKWKSSITERLEKICNNNGKVPRAIAHAIIARSAWWELHPSGPVRAPNHAERIEEESGSWVIGFGANTFLVSVAICRCCSRIKEWALRQQGNIPANSWAELYSSLSRTLRGAVSNYAGDEYDVYGDFSQDKIIFGAQAISINDFIKGLGKELALDEIYTFKSQSKLYGPPIGSFKRNKNIPLWRQCPWCSAEVAPGQLGTHMSDACPNNPASRRSSSPAQKNTKAVAPTTATNSSLHERAMCPWCGVWVSKSKLATHQASRCPKRPSRT